MGATIPKPSVESLQHEKRDCFFCSTKSKTWKSLAFGDSQTPLCIECHFIRTAIEQSIATKVFTISVPGGDIRHWSVNGRHEVDRPRFSGSIDYPKDGLLTSIAFELFTLPGMPKPFPDFPVKEPPTSTASPDCLAQVQEWLEICRRSHSLCEARSPGLIRLPKRVLDVSNHQIRLYEAIDAYDEYICLSHCWGDTRPSCRTTSANYEDNKRGIDWDALPATFQDSIDFTRRMGSRFIWIDSICIIQDDAQDWAEQSALMASIYENACLTLCATAASSDDGGCYFSTPTHWESQRIRVQKKDGVEYDSYIRYEFKHRHLPSWQYGENEEETRHFPLMTRAWAYQERLLSPRLIHFTRGELMWECCHFSACECFSSGLKKSPYMGWSAKRGHRDSLLKPDHPSWFQNWHNIIYTYSGLNLTLEKDKLPALSGIAKQQLRLRPGDEYVAGLWKSTIMENLKWTTKTVVFGGKISRPTKNSRPTIWRSPSWSWAAIDGPIYYHIYYHNDMDSNKGQYARCTEVSVTLSGPDSTGEVSSGYLVMDAPVCSVQLQVNERLEPFVEFKKGVDVCAEEWGSWSLSAAGLEVDFYPDCQSDFKTGLLTIGDGLLCLRLGVETYCYFCLILKQRGKDGATPLYERVGYVAHDMEELEEHWFPPGMECTTVKIV